MVFYLATVQASTAFWVDLKTNFLAVFYFETNAVSLVGFAVEMATLEASRGAFLDDPPGTPDIGFGLV